MPIQRALGHRRTRANGSNRPQKRSSRPQSDLYSVAVAPRGTRNVFTCETGCTTGIQPLRNARIAGYFRETSKFIKKIPVGGALYHGNRPDTDGVRPARTPALRRTRSGGRWRPALDLCTFLDRCDRWSSALQALGVRQGDRVAYIAPNTHAHLEGYYAVPQIGAVLVPINYGSSRKTSTTSSTIAGRRSFALMPISSMPWTASAGDCRRRALRGAGRFPRWLDRLRIDTWSHAPDFAKQISPRPTC